MHRITRRAKEKEPQTTYLIKPGDKGSQDTGGCSDTADGNKVTWVAAVWEQIEGKQRLPDVLRARHCRD